MTEENHGLFYKFSKVFISLLIAMFPLGGDKNMRELRILRVLRVLRVLRKLGKQNEPLSTR